jgi:hypothetical protein
MSAPTGLTECITPNVQLADIRVFHEDVVINFLGLLHPYLEGREISSSGQWKECHLRRYR